MKILKQMLVISCVCVLLMNISVQAEDKEDFSIEPIKNDGKKWRIGYYEGGEYINYQNVLIATLKEFMDIGWIETAEIPPQKGVQTKDIWQWLVNDAKSEYIEFVEDAHYSSNWDRDLREKIAVEIVERLNQKNDIDLMIAMGTWAGLELANDKHHIPTVVLSTSDPLKSDIIKSIEDSGYDHVHARVSPLRYERQVQIFYDIIGFQKLGVAYEDTQSGKSIAAIGDIEKVSQEMGFEIISCHTIDDTPDVKIAEESVKKCFEELSTQVDAIYVTQQNGVNVKTLSELVEIFNSDGIPTFSQSGSHEVRRGILLSIARAGFIYIGRFHAETFAKIFNGAKPRQLDQVFENPPKIAINLKTAEIIGYDPPVDVLGAADEIYQEIEKPEE